jgi:hypothetical protein
LGSFVAFILPAAVTVPAWLPFLRCCLFVVCKGCGGGFRKVPDVAAILEGVYFKLALFNKWVGYCFSKPPSLQWFAVLDVWS